MKTVLVTAIGSFAADAVIQIYKKEGFRVIGCDIYPAAWVANSGETERFYQAPYATDRQAYIQCLEKICKKEAVDYVIPLTDAEVDVLTTLEAGALGALVCISEPEAIRLCRDKYLLEQFLRPLGICETIPGWRLSEVDLERLEYPVVVKPFHGRSSQGLRRVKTRGQMERVLEECSREAENYLVQPEIPGQVITVDVVREAESGRTVCLPRRELLRTLNGAGTSVFVFRDEKLEEQCRAIAGALGIRGCVNLEFVEESRDKRYFLECNPRFAGGVAFSCKAGYDMVRNHLRCFEGEPIEDVGEIREQYIARRYQEFVMEPQESQEG